MYYTYLYGTILHGIIKRQSNFHTTFLIWVKDSSLRPNDHFMLFSFTQPTQVIIILLNYSLWHSFYIETKNTVITKFSTWCCIVKETKRKKKKFSGPRVFSTFHIIITIITLLTFYDLIQHFGRNFVRFS